MLVDFVVGGGPPVGLTARMPRVVKVREAGLGDGLGGQVSGPVGVGPRAGGRLGRVSSGGQRVGRRALAGERRIQVRRAVELGGQCLTVPGGPLVSFGGLAQLSPVLVGQLREPLVRGSDVPVQVVQGLLKIRQPDRCELSGFGLELLADRDKPLGFAVAADLPTLATEAERLRSGPTGRKRGRRQPPAVLRSSRPVPLRSPLRQRRPLPARASRARL